MAAPLMMSVDGALPAICGFVPPSPPFRLANAGRDRAQQRSQLAAKMISFGEWGRRIKVLAELAAKQNFQSLRQLPDSIFTVWAMPL
ncbi:MULTISPECIES: hypothetical protein [unclassified Mesorhizobium]|uniref:hypothetical protein n=1 Tax=unclassified Mesorhizobium TaxID=325217 RepID=UPI003335DD9C